EISAVIAVGDPATKGAQQFVILKCEKQVPDEFQKYPLDAGMKQRLENALHEKKESMAAGVIIAELKQKWRVTKVLGDDKLMQQYPGVAAFIGQQSITLATLGEECVHRHGTEVLEGTISRRVLEQRCRSAGVAVSQEEIT